MGKEDVNFREIIWVYTEISIPERPLKPKKFPR